MKKPWVRKLLEALAVAIGGLVLLNLAFLLNFAVFSLLDLLVPQEWAVGHTWYAPARHGLFLVIIGVISWIIFASRLGVIYKSVFMTVPVAVVLVSLGIFLYPQPVLPYVIGGALMLGLLYIFYRTRQPWLYYYSVLLVTLALMAFTLLGGEI